MNARGATNDFWRRWNRDLDPHPEVWRFTRWTPCIHKLPMASGARAFTPLQYKPDRFADPFQSVGLARHEAA
ncbi:MAG: hypothetical protein L0Z50_31540 [Verrucomicrobiales bacterium]|nr:hypothetical protein [Verrucomicrobiales bacterium]